MADIDKFCGKKICLQKKFLEKLPIAELGEMASKVADLQKIHLVKRGDTLGQIVDERYNFLTSVDENLAGDLVEMLLDQVPDRNPAKLEINQVLSFKGIDEELSQILLKEKYTKLPDGRFEIKDPGLDIKTFIPESVRYIRVDYPNGENVTCVRAKDQFAYFNPDKGSATIMFLPVKGAKIELLENFSEQVALGSIKGLPAFRDRHRTVSPDEPLAIDEINGKKVILRINALRSLTSAIKKLHSHGMEIAIMESFRTTEDQQGLKRKLPFLADLPNLGVHQSGGAIDAKLITGDKKKFEEIMNENGFYAVFSSEKWHFEFMPNNKKNDDKPYKTYKIIEGFSDLPKDDLFKLISDALRSIDNDAEKKYMAFVIYRAVGKFSDFPKTKEGVNLLISILHRESWLRQYPQLSEDSLKKIKDFMVLFDDKERFDEFLRKKLSRDSSLGDFPIRHLQGLDDYKELYTMVSDTINMWKKGFSDGFPKTEYDISRLKNMVMNKIEPVIKVKYPDYLANILLNVFIDMLDKLSPRSIGIGQINYKKIATDLPKYPELDLPENFTREELEDYLYSIEGGLNAAILYVNKLVSAQKSYGTSDLLDNIEYLISEYNVGEYSCRNSFFQGVLNKLTVRAGMDLEIVEDGDLGELTQKALNKIAEKYKLDLSSDQIQEDLKLQKKSGFIQTKSYKLIMAFYKPANHYKPPSQDGVPQSFPKIKSQLDVSIKSYVGGTLLRLMSKLDFNLFVEIRDQYAKNKKTDKDKLNPEDYCNFWPDFRDKYRLKLKNPVEAKTQKINQPDRSGDFAKLGAKLYGLSGKSIKADSADFHKLTGAEHIAVQQYNSNYLGVRDQVNDWRIAKWDPNREKYCFMDHFSRPVKFLNDFVYKIRIESSGIEKKFNPDNFIKTKYGIEIYGQGISKTGEDFYKKFGHKKIAVNGLDAHWEEGKKNYCYLHDKKLLEFVGGNKYVIENRAYLDGVEKKVKRDIDKITKKIQGLMGGGKLKLKENQNFIFVNKSAAKQYIILASLRGKDVEVLDCDLVSTAQYEHKTPEGVYKVTRVSNIEHWGKRFGLERNEYPYKIFDISIGGQGLAIHPTNHPEKLGTTASKGCARIPFSFSRILERKAGRGVPVIIGNL